MQCSKLSINLKPDLDLNDTEISCVLWTKQSRSKEVKLGHHKQSWWVGVTHGKITGTPVEQERTQEIQSEKKKWKFVNFHDLQVMWTNCTDKKIYWQHIYINFILISTENMQFSKLSNNLKPDLDLNGREISCVFWKKQSRWKELKVAHQKRSW